MAKFSKILFISLLVLTVILGLEQLSYENKVFAYTLAPCCNLDPCGCDGLNCNSPTSYKTFVTGKPYCTGDYMFTCGECVDLVAIGGQLCPWGPSTAYCMDGDECYGWCDGEWVLSK